MHEVDLTKREQLRQILLKSLSAMTLILKDYRCTSQRANRAHSL